MKHALRRVTASHAMHATYTVVKQKKCGDTCLYKSTTAEHGKQYTINSPGNGRRKFNGQALLCRVATTGSVVLTMEDSIIPWGGRVKYLGCYFSSPSGEVDL